MMFIRNCLFVLKNWRSEEAKTWLFYQNVLQLLIKIWRRKALCGHIALRVLQLDLGLVVEAAPEERWGTTAHGDSPWLSTPLVHCRPLVGLPPSSSAIVLFRLEDRARQWTLESGRFDMKCLNLFDIKHKYKISIIVHNQGPKSKSIYNRIFLIKL